MERQAQVAAYGNDFRRLQRRTLAVLYMTYATFYLSRKADSVVKSSLHLDEGFGVEDLAMMDTVYLLVYTVMLALSGVLGSYFSSSTLLSVSLVCLAGTSFLKSRASTPAAFAACQALHACFQSAGWPCCIKMLGTWVTENRGLTMGLWATCQSLGGIVGALLATSFVSKMGWRYAYLYHIPIMLFFAVVCKTLLFDDPAEALGEDAPRTPASEALVAAEDGKSGPAGGDNGKGAANKPSLRKILALPGVVPIGVAYFFLKFLRYALLMWLPFLYEEDLHFSKVTAGYISTSFEMGGLFGTPFIGWYSDRRMGGKRDLTAAWFMTGAACMLIMCIVVAHGGALINATCMFFVGILVIGPDSVLSGTIAQDLGSASPMGPQVIGTLAGLINSVGSAGSIFQSYVTAGINGAYGWSTLFCVFACCALLSASILFRVALSGVSKKGLFQWPWAAAKVPRRATQAALALAVLFVVGWLRGPGLSRTPAV